MKAILITNIPKDCTFCPCHTYMSNYTDLNGKKQRSMCKELGKLFNVGKGRPSWCPLRPLSHKLQADWYTDGYKEGFNACLDEITGKTECTTQKKDT